MKKVLFLFGAVLVPALFFSCGGTPPPVEEAPPVVVEAAPVPPPPPPPPPAPPPAPPPPPPEETAEPVDTSPPQLTVEMLPQPFSPDGDGEGDELTVKINVDTKSDIHAWHIQIREPLPPYLLFAEWSGDASTMALPETIVKWDGRSPTGELVQSATEYPFALRVTNVYNESTLYEGTIDIDVLVHREGDTLRVIVPSIVFASNTGDFSKLDSAVMENNDRILRRIAEVLNRFGTYKVKVEGHANPTTAPGTRARTNEERGSSREKGLQPLSEERANAVVDYLADLGVDRSRLTAFGIGGARAVAEFEDRDNWWKNRRVEFLLEK